MTDRPGARVLELQPCDHPNRIGKPECRCPDCGAFQDNFDRWCSSVHVTDRPCDECGRTGHHVHLLDQQDPDLINHPPHYTAHPSGVECITITEHMSFNLGNAMKYIWRADEKGSAIEDLEKARWYVEREIQRRQAGAA